MSDSEPTALLPWALAGVSSCIGALSAALLFVFRLREVENANRIADLENRLNDTAAKADKCEHDRMEVTAQCRANTVQIAMLQEQLDLLKRLSCDVVGCKQEMRK